MNDTKPKQAMPEWFKKAFADARTADRLGISMEELALLKERKPWSLKHWRLTLKVNCKILMIMGDGYRALRAQRRADKPA